MILTQEHLADEQVICWNCEETVHESATQCPYCYVEVNRHQVEKASEKDQKVTPFLNTPHKAPDESPAKGGTFSFLTSLLFLLSGSALFFLAVLIAFFARNGGFVLRWSEQSWSSFLGLGMAFLAFGTIFLQNVPGSSDP